MLGKRRPSPSICFTDLVHGNFSQLKHRYRKVKRTYYLTIFLPAVLLAIIYRAVQEYAKLKLFHTKKGALTGQVSFRPEIVEIKPAEKKEN